ncbi:MAG: isoprenylcysteine carboxylmethyltransferase family protein [Desulfobacteraceae bacterium]|nr:isoprenylcysteine carboxylmethyltransferase family protein [Desulfobacteraceae bacterium]
MSIKMNPKTSDTLEALLGTLIFLFGVLPIFLVWIPYEIITSPKIIYVFGLGEIRYLGMIPIFIGVIVYVWCSNNFVFEGKGTPIPFTPTKKLIVKGLYMFVRNPLYVAGVMVLTGEALLFQSIGIFIYCLAMFAAFNFHVFMEETLLTNQFGETYEEYKKHVPRWIPRLTPYRV